MRNRIEAIIRELRWRYTIIRIQETSRGKIRAASHMAKGFVELFKPKI